MKTLIIVILAALVSLPAFSKPKDCEANYSWNSINFSGDIYLGDVKTPKKKNCKELAISKGPGIVAQKKSLLNLPQLSSANWAGYCKNGLSIYADTTVEGKKNSKDGSFTIKPSCTMGNGACLEYQQVFVSGSF